MKRPFSEQLSEFRGILGASLGMALTTWFMWKPYSRSNSRSDSRNWLDAKSSAQMRGRKTHPKSRNTKKNAFTRTLSNSSRELLPSSLWHESVVQKHLFRWTFFIRGGFFRVDFPPQTNSRSVSFKIGVVPARQIIIRLKMLATFANIPTLPNIYLETNLQGLK